MFPASVKTIKNVAPAPVFFSESSNKVICSMPDDTMQGEINIGDKVVIDTTVRRYLQDGIQQNNGSDFFNMQAGQQDIQVNIIGGISGVRALVDAYYLEAIQLHYPNWEQLAILLLTKSLDGSELTKSGWEFWESMVNDMGSTVEGQAK